MMLAGECCLSWRLIVNSSSEQPTTNAFVFETVRESHPHFHRVACCQMHDTYPLAGLSSYQLLFDLPSENAAALIRSTHENVRAHDCR
jgi:hypothetical protein